MFVVFDGIANVKPILDARIKLLKAEEDLKKSNNFEPSYRNDEFYSPIVIDGTYHNIKVLLYEHLIQKKIIIKPHGYFSWQEAKEVVSSNKIKSLFIEFSGFPKSADLQN